MDYPNPDLLVDVDWLSDHREDPDLVLVDCPWDDNAFTRAHIPGAVVRPGHPYIKEQNEDGDPELHVLGPKGFEALAAELGIGDGKRIVLYDDWGNHFAARLWWVLRYYGFENAALLDGGWQGWVEAGKPVSVATTEPSPAPAFSASPQPHRIVATDELLAEHAGPAWQVLDCRSDSEYEGSSSSNRRAGHIPEAVHIEWSRFLENGGDHEAVRRFRSADEIQALLEAAGVERDATIVTHCQAAVRGAHGAFVLELMGYRPPRLYDGSMAEWANRDDTPLS